MGFPYKMKPTVMQASPTALVAALKMTLSDVSKTHRWDNKARFYSHDIKSADKWSQNWQLRCWETFMAPKRPLPWFHLQILLQTKKTLGSNAANSGSSQRVQHHLGISLIQQHAHHSSDLPSKLHHSSIFGIEQTHIAPSKSGKWIFSKQKTPERCIA